MALGATYGSTHYQRISTPEPPRPQPSLPFLTSPPISHGLSFKFNTAIHSFLLHSMLTNSFRYPRINHTSCLSCRVASELANSTAHQNLSPFAFHPSHRIPRRLFFSLFVRAFPLVNTISATYYIVMSRAVFFRYFCRVGSESEITSICSK